MYVAGVGGGRLRGVTVYVCLYVCICVCFSLFCCYYFRFCKAPFERCDALPKIQVDMLPFFPFFFFSFCVCVYLRVCCDAGFGYIFVIITFG